MKTNKSVKRHSPETKKRSAAKLVTPRNPKAKVIKGKSSSKDGSRKPLSSVRSTPSRPTRVTVAKSGRGKVSPVLRRELTPEEIQHKKHLLQFEEGVKHFSEGNFLKARDIFERLTSASSPDLAQRSRMYLSISNQRLSRPALRLKTADDYYNYAVSMANQGNQEEAELNLNKASKLDPKSDYVYYALATTHAQRGNAEAALENLQKAIELNERNRYLAQNDSDFANLGEDPRFTELIYPERPVS